MDIVERLRLYRPTYGWPEEKSVIVEPTLNHVAADEIERLRKQNAVLETELALVRSMLPNVKAYQTGTGDFTPLEEEK